MGRAVVRMMKCNICKASYPSFSIELRSKLTQRSHRIQNPKCLKEQDRLRKLHEEAGNIGDLVFLDDDEVVEAATDGMSDGGEWNIEFDEGQSQQSDDAVDNDPENTEVEKKEDSDFEMEDDFAEEKDIDDIDSDADSVDSYDRSKKMENLMYDASEVWSWNMMAKKIKEW